MENKYLNKLIEFERMEKKHKETMFDIKKEFAQKKLDLLKKTHSEKTDICIEELEEISRQGYKPEITEKYLKRKIDQHENELKDWRMLCEQKDNKFKEWLEKNRIERENFKKGL